jgi:hypothetical protein
MGMTSDPLAASASDELPPLPERRWLPMWVAVAFLGFALVLLPWSAWLSITLPRKEVAYHWPLLWTGFDLLLAAVLACTAIGLLRRSAWVLAAAGASAALLICDAWFDILTSPASNRWIAITEAAVIEIPLAVACLVIARDAERAFERARKVADTAHRLAVTRSHRTRDADRPLP